MTTNDSKKLVTSLPSDLEFEMVRSFEAPIDLVFRAFSDKELVPQWWGQHESTTVVEELDFRSGGAWRFVQHTPDGAEHGFRGEFREIEPPHRIVWTFSYDPIPGSLVETFTLEQIGESTRVTSTSLFDTKEERDGMCDSCMEDGAAESYDRLEELLDRIKMTG